MTLERWFAKGGLVVTVFIVVVAVIINDASRASSISNGGGAGGGGAAGQNVTTTFSATPTFTCPSATQGTVVNFALSTALTANITSSTLAGCTNGSLLNFIFTQDATGGRTVVMPAGFDTVIVNPGAGVITKCAYFLDAGGNGRLAAGGCVSNAGYGFGLEAPAPATPPASSCFAWFDSTNHIRSYKCNNSATVSNAVIPASRPANQFVTSLSVAGVLGFNALTQGDLPSNSTLTIASGQTAMPTAALGGNACSAAATTAVATGAVTTDAVAVTFASDPTGVLGYGGGTNGGITIVPWPTTNQMNFKLCNQTGSSITPGAINVNWRDTR